MQLGLQVSRRSVLAILMLIPAALVAQTRSQPGIKLALNEIEAQMFRVSAGKRLKPN
jgi:urease gamma subunit